MSCRKFLFFSIVFGLVSIFASAQNHPKLILTAEGVDNIKAQINDIPLLKQTLEKTIKQVEKEMAKGIVVPIPKDLAGGYTHVQHKKNYSISQQAGALFQITEDEKYAIYVRDVLLEYAKMYPTLSNHPVERSYAPGKIFWQCLNDANWLVYMSQAYDCIYDWLSADQRKLLEEDLFRPFADHISIDSPKFFNRIHNHSTWGTAAVGMIGFVMDDEELIDRALYGLNVEELPEDPDSKESITMPKQKDAGFIAQLDYPFSPDGYYNEGPYYQRYAMYPFVVMAEAIENCKPELKIFEYRDSVLIKAVTALLNLTDEHGQFFPINDSQKGMSYLSKELVSSVNIAYHFGGNDPKLLSIAKLQNKVLLDDTGLSVAKGLKENKEQEFVKKSMALRDGPNGTQGGVGIIRAEKSGDKMCLLMKYTSQGLGHGHFDKLSFSLYHKGEEVLQDYGVARFVNIDQKYGGGYLPENKTWAKQSIAHNTLVINKKSHFKGSTKRGNQYHSYAYFFDAEDSDIQIVSAKDSNAYPGVIMHRTMAVIDDKSFKNPIVVDIFRAKTEKASTYDLPYHYFGQIMSTNFNYSSFDTLTSLGEKYGYQHLWKEAQGKATETSSRFTWMHNKTFYSIITATTPDDKLVMARMGANDPNFNLRRDPSFIIRKPKQDNVIFCSVIQAHGSYNYVTENALNAVSSIASTSVLFDSEDYTAVQFKNTENKKWILFVSNSDSSNNKEHELTIAGQSYQWKGAWKLFVYESL